MGKPTIPQARRAKHLSNPCSLTKNRNAGPPYPDKRIMGNNAVHLTRIADHRFEAPRENILDVLDRLQRLGRCGWKSLPSYSAMLTPEPPISFGTSFIFGNPSLMCSFDS